MTPSRPRSAARLATAVVALTLVALPVYGQQPSSAVPVGCSVGNAAPGTRVLVFSRTTGFRHASIPDGIAAIRTLGATHGFVVEATEDPTQFSDQNLARFNAVVFMSTTGDILDSAQQAAFQRYIHGGGGYVGVHSATDTEYDWPWYGQLVGAYFASHPKGTPTATVRVVDAKHPATAGLPVAWERTDEWYNFKAPPHGVRVLAKVDESTYTGGTMNGDHPIAWCHEVEGGRAFYTAMGHTVESYKDPVFLGHLLGGIRYAAGDEPAR